MMTTTTPVRLVNSRGQPLEVIGGDEYAHSPRPPSPAWPWRDSFMHRRDLSYVDPLFHHPDFDDYSSSASSIGDSLEQSSFSDSDSNHDTASVITVPPQEQEALTTPTAEESECQLGGILRMLARAFSNSKTTHQTPYEYSGDPDNALEKTMTCPISKEIMMDPVMDPDGHSYERAAILQWLYQDSRSPITRKPLSRRDLVPNRALRAVIHQYIQMGGATGLKQQQHQGKKEDVRGSNE